MVSKERGSKDAGTAFRTDRFLTGHSFTRAGKRIDKTSRRDLPRQAEKLPAHEVL